MKTNKTKILTKIISCFLCTAITLQVGFALTGEKVNAAGTMGLSSVGDGTVLTVGTSDSGTSHFNITSSGGKYHIENQSPASGEDSSYDLSEISKIVIDGWAIADTQTDIETAIEFVDDSASLYIEKGTLTATSISGTGWQLVVYDNGTLKCDSFTASNFKDFTSIVFYGTLIANNLDLTPAANTNGSYISTSDNAKYYVTSSFTNGTRDLYGTVIAEPNTTISSAGGNFTLQVGDAKKDITGQVSNKKAIELMDNPNITFDKIPSVIYVGEDYDFESLVHYNTSYPGSWVLRYSSNNSSWTTDKPSSDSEGSYYVYAYAPASDSFIESSTKTQQFEIKYYDLDDVSDSGEYFTLEGLDKSGKYIVEDKLTIKPVEGFQIACSSGDNAHTFQDQLELSEEQISYVGGQINGDMYFYFQKSDGPHAGARTENIYASSIPSLKDLIFETEAPDIYGIIPEEEEEGESTRTRAISGDGVEPVMALTSILIKDGDTIKADKLTFGFADRTLTSVTVDGTTYTRSSFDENDSGVIYYSSDSFTSTPGKSQKITVSATDALNRTSSATVTLKSPELGDVSASVSLSPTVYYGDSYKPKVTVNGIIAGTDEESFDYVLFYDGAEEPNDAPTDVGTHTVYASVSFDYYDNIIETEEISFTIAKRSFTPSVTVSDILPIETPSPVITGVPEDYEEEPTITYKDSTGAVHEEGEPFAEGTYTVSVVFPETERYLGSSCSTSFKVAKDKFTPSVTVADILPDETPEPVITGVPEDYEEKPVITYKDSTGAVHKDGEAFTAGTYTVSVVFPATDKYAGASCSASFTVAKNKFTPSVSVANITVGETPNPLVKGVPSDYDGTVTCEYKLSSAADTAYSSATPDKGGEYTVRATFSGSKKYIDTTCTSSFIVKKKVVKATVYVANITVGDTPNPIVDTESDGKSKATFEYSSDSGKTFSSAVPAEAGTYMVRATIPETDKYEKIVCTASFSISKKKVQKLKLSVPNTFAGLPVTPTVDTDSDGVVTITYTSSGSGSSTTAPTKVGTYTAIATVSETKTYQAASCETSFTISYLGAPSPAYSFKGTPGKNGYYTSDVDVLAPSGFSISTTFGAGYGGSVSYSENMTVYLRRSDGALTGPVSVSDKPKIDKESPSISFSTGAIANGSVVYASSLSISASDKHLASLTVNGSSVSSGTTLSPGMWWMPVTVTAEDEAGNISSVSFTLKAAWLEFRIIPADVELPLPPNEEFYLGEGMWKITKVVNGEEIVDPTIYNGELPIYLDGEADYYIFTRVS